MNTRKVKIEIDVDMPDVDDTEEQVRKLLMNSLYKSQSELEIGTYTLSNPIKHMQYTQLLNAVASMTKTRIKVSS